MRRGTQAVCRNFLVRGDTQFPVKFALFSTGIELGRLATACQAIRISGLAKVQIVSLGI